MTRRVRRSLAALAAGTALVWGTALPASAAPAPEDAAMSWLNGHLLTDGGMPGVMEDTADWGLTIDALLASVASGAPKQQVDQMWQGVEAHATEYAGPSWGTTRGGASAKVLLAALVVGEDPTKITNADGTTVDLVAQTSSLIERTSGTRDGRLHDEGGFDNANIFGQSLAVMAFSHDRVLPGHGEEAQALVDHLLTQQCSPGYWRMFSSDGKTCEEADPGRDLVDNDGTAIALMALRSADRAGLEVPRDAITRGLDDLERRQKPDGGFGGGVSTAGANSNSTGLAGSMLSLYGRTTAGDKARSYVTGLQVGDSGLPDGSGDEVGAIAYNADSLASARSSGIGPARDQFRRATAQAVLALTPAAYGELDHTYTPAPPPSPKPEPTPTPDPSPEPEPSSPTTGEEEPGPAPQAGAAPAAPGAGPGAAPAGGRPGGGSGVPGHETADGEPSAAGALPVQGTLPGVASNNAAGDPQSREQMHTPGDGETVRAAAAEAEPTTGVKKAQLPSQQWVAEKRSTDAASGQESGPEAGSSISTWVAGAGALVLGCGAGAVGLFLTRRKGA